MRRWQQVLESVLWPARPHLARCLAARDEHLPQHRANEEARARALRDCIRRIEASRAAAFAANDGVVPAEMNALEREWRRLSRDTEQSVMDLWARIAPPAWIDRKLWRDTAREQRIEAAVALASDPDGVEAAISAVAALRAAVPTPFGPRVRFRMQEHDKAHCDALFEAPLRGLAAHAAVLAHAKSIEAEVHAAALARWPGRHGLVVDLSRAAFVDAVWHACEPVASPSPVEPLLDLWRSGYLLSSVDRAGVTLEIPPFRDGERGPVAEAIFSG